MKRETYTSVNQSNGTGHLIIELPASLKGKQVRVTLEEANLPKEEKIRLMQLAESDPLFQKDVAELIADFEHIDKEMQ